MIVYDKRVSNFSTSITSGGNLRSWRAERFFFFFPSLLILSLYFSSILHILDYTHRVSRQLETPMMRSIFRGSSLIRIPLGTPANVLVISSESAGFMFL